MTRAFCPKASWLSLGAFLFDLMAVVCAWLIAYVVRFNGAMPPEFLKGAFVALAWVVPLYGLLFHVFGLYRGLWVFASLPDLLRISKAVVGGGLIVMIGAVMLQPVPIIPRSVLVLSPMLLFLAMGGARALYRATKEFYLYGGLIGQGKPVLILGAGSAGASLARELSRSGEWRLAGLLDDDPAKHGREVYGYKVLGSIGEVADWAEAAKAEYAIIAIPSASVEAQRRFATLCVRAGVRAMVLPSLTALMPGQGILSQIRQIDLEDLLGREAVTIDTPHVEALLRGRVVMVTGAGGSIGSELCRQILKFQPAQLIAFDLSEYAMYRLTEELRERFPDLPVVPIIGDAKDSLLLDQVMSRYAPHIVFHAAAYKHVPLMEELNAWQALRNNVLGTYRVARAAIRHDVRHFVLISTDKAVNPTNVMGASKRLAEMACQALQQTSAHAVRDGALRQRARQRRQRDSEISAADRQGRPGDRHASGNHALLHDDSRGVATRAAGVEHGAGRRDLHSRHGRAGEDRRSRARSDSPVRLHRGADPHRVQRAAPGREAL